jgi:hypothetical protein
MKCGGARSYRGREEGRDLKFLKWVSAARRQSLSARFSNKDRRLVQTVGVEDTISLIQVSAALLPS